LVPPLEFFVQHLDGGFAGRDPLKVHTDLAIVPFEPE